MSDSEALPSGLIKSLRGLRAINQLLLGPVLLDLAIQTLLDAALMFVTAGTLLLLWYLLFLLLMVVLLLFAGRGWTRVVRRGVNRRRTCPPSVAEGFKANQRQACLNEGRT